MIEYTLFMVLNLSWSINTPSVTLNVPGYNTKSSCLEAGEDLKTEFSTIKPTTGQNGNGPRLRSLYFVCVPNPKGK